LERVILRKKEAVMSRAMPLYRPARNVESDIALRHAAASVRSRFEALTEASSRISPGRATVLALLVGAADPRACGGSAVLRPLWANEAVHRAWSLTRLLLRLDWRDAGGDPFLASFERRIAEDLARGYRELHITSDAALQPCSQVLQDTVINLVELLSPSANRIRVCTAIDPVVLAEFKRRALVLLGSELVTNALTHAFNGRTGGRIHVTLQALTGGNARLIVADDGCGMKEHGMQPRSIAHDLADLLASDLDRRAGPNGGTCAQVVFACRS
jgi:two-component sensor histidine kinase